MGIDSISALPSQSVSHSFYEKLGRLLAKHGFDDFAEALCRPLYAKKMGRPSPAPSQYFRLLLLGYFHQHVKMMKRDHKASVHIASYLNRRPDRKTLRPSGDAPESQAQDFPNMF